MHSLLLLTGGDGATLGRMLHRIAQNPHLYLMTTPIVIPELGEHPHGSHHLLDGGMRLWRPFVLGAAEVVGNPQIVAEPNVTDFNAHQHFMIHTLGRACFMYILEISKTGGTSPYAVHQFMAAAERNLSFAIIVHYAYDFVCLFRQFRDSVRRNKSRAIDLCWCESLPMLRQGHKTKYSYLAVNRVYWGNALIPDIQKLYENTRSLLLHDTYVGYDMFVEKVNWSIHQHVQSHITEERICKHLDKANFYDVVERGMVSLDARAFAQPYLKKVDADVSLLLEWMRTSVGTSYQQAFASKNTNDLNLDISERGGTVARMPRAVPWVSVRRTLQDQRQYIIDSLVKLCHWHKWA
jgi:hypothetical protein